MSVMNVLVTVGAFAMPFIGCPPVVERALSFLVELVVVCFNSWLAVVTIL